MAVLTAVVPGPAGTAPSFVAAAGGGDRAPCGPKNYLHVKNASGGAITVTVDSVVPCNYGSDHDLVVSVPATTGERLIGPLSPERYASTSDGLAAITYSGVTSLTVMVVSL